MSCATGRSIRTEEWGCCRCGDGRSDSWGMANTNCLNCNHMQCKECHTHESATALTPTTTSTHCASNIGPEPRLSLLNDLAGSGFIDLEEVTASTIGNGGSSTFDHEVDVYSNVLKRRISRPTPLESWYRNFERHEFISQGLRDSSEPIDLISKPNLSPGLSDVSAYLEPAQTLEVESLLKFIDEGRPLINDRQLELKGIGTHIKVASGSIETSGTDNISSLQSFISNPVPYFEDVSSLEDRVSRLGNSTFKNIKRSYGQSVLPLPTFELDMTPFNRPRPLIYSEPPTSYQQPPSSLPLSP